MKKSFWRRLVGLGFIVLVMVGLGYGQGAGVESLTILYTNDLHAHLLAEGGRGGFANVAGYIKEVRGSGRRVLVLNGGDMVQGTPVSTLFSGVPIFEILNSCGYDAAVLGNHDFDYGLERLAEYRKVAAYPILSANVLLGGKLVADEAMHVFDLKGLKVGVLGLTTWEFIDGVTVLRPEAMVKRYLPELKRQSDLVVVLTHLGVEEDKRLARTTRGIDVIVGGHSHTALHEPVKVGETLIVQAGRYGECVGELDLKVDRMAKKVVGYEGRLVAIPAAKVRPDPAVQKLVACWEGKVSGLVDIRIGFNPVSMDVGQVTAAIERAWQETYKTDFAFQNEGSTRDTLAAGNIMIRHIYNIYPFDNTLMILDLDRDQVRRILPKAVFKEEKPFYTLITNSYIGRETIAKYGLPRERVHPIRTLIREGLIEYIRKHGNLGSPSSQPAGVQGRIQSSLELKLTGFLQRPIYNVIARSNRRSNLGFPVNKARLLRRVLLAMTRRAFSDVLT